MALVLCRARRSVAVVDAGEPGSRLRHGWSPIGKKDIWKLYVHDQKELLTSSTGKDRKAEAKAVLKMSKH